MRLIDSGLRPAKVVNATSENLTKMLDDVRLSSPDHFEHPDAIPIVAWILQHDPEFLRQCLHGELRRVGLRSFVTGVMPQMNELVGHAWVTGQIAICDEHAYTEIVHQIVSMEIAKKRDVEGSPRVLLTTPVGELHMLGILSLTAVLVLQGAYCLSLGAQTPLEEIDRASRDYGIEIVCLSFSINFPRRRIVPILRELRQRLPAEKQLWAGGAGTALLQGIPRGVIVLDAFPENDDINLTSANTISTA